MKKEVSDKYSRDYSLNYQTSKISELIDSGKIPLARKIIFELLKEYPYDITLNINLAIILIFDKKYEEAKFILESLPEEFVFNKLANVYIKLNEENKLFELYDKYYKEDILGQVDYRGVTYNRLKIYLNKKYNINYSIDPKSSIYSDFQIFDYSDHRAIDHIKRHHLFCCEEDKGRFYDSIDIKDLFYDVKRYIDFNKDKANLKKNVIENYTFKSIGCGEEDKINCDYFKVITIINTSDIITMYPIKNLGYGDICYLDEKTDDKGYVKVKSGLERFKSKYNK